MDSDKHERELERVKALLMEVVPLIFIDANSATVIGTVLTSMMYAYLESLPKEMRQPLMEKSMLLWQLPWHEDSKETNR